MVENIGYHFRIIVNKKKLSETLYKLKSSNLYIFAACKYKPMIF